MRVGPLVQDLPIVPCLALGFLGWEAFRLRFYPDKGKEN